jgi:hypothetical protein
LKIEIERKSSGGWIRLSSTIDGLTLWFEVEERFDHMLTTGPNPFLIGWLFTAMRTNKPMEILQPVDEDLMRNLLELQRVWARWKPELYRPVPLRAPALATHRSIPGKTICAFSGGIDGAFALWDNTLNVTNPFPYPVEALLHVQGLHIPLDRMEEQQILHNRIATIASELRLDLLVVRTNIRRFGNWYDFHGAALAACLHLFEPAFSSALIGSSHPYSYLRFPWGSNPVTDALLSSSTLQIRNYGGGYTRFEKTQSLIQWEPYQQIVAVCTESFKGNCGKCEKCIRTLLSYRILNTPAPSTFVRRQVSIYQLLTIIAYQPQEIKDYGNLLDHARQQGRRGIWLLSLTLNRVMNKLILATLNTFGMSSLPVLRKKRSKLYQYNTEC